MLVAIVYGNWFLWLHISTLSHESRGSFLLAETSLVSYLVGISKERQYYTVGRSSMKLTHSNRRQKPFSHERMKMAILIMTKMIMITMMIIDDGEDSHDDNGGLLRKSSFNSRG